MLYVVRAVLGKTQNTPTPELCGPPLKICDTQEEAEKHIEGHNSNAPEWWDPSWGEPDDGTLWGVETWSAARFAEWVRDLLMNIKGRCDDHNL